MLHPHDVLEALLSRKQNPEKLFINQSNPKPFSALKMKEDCCPCNKDWGNPPPPPKIRIEARTPDPALYLNTIEYLQATISSRRCTKTSVTPRDGFVPHLAAAATE